MARDGMSSPVHLQALAKAVRLHPRVAHQDAFTEKQLEEMAAAVPPLVSFRGKYHSAIAVVDWDHRLPSTEYTLRIYAYYGATSAEVGTNAYHARSQQIAARDLYPEFDVPDLSELPADETYEVELGAKGQVSACRLTSEWRRDVAAHDAQQASRIARETDEFRQIVALAPDRPKNLGGLEAVAWTAPCESGHPRWTIDVWYLLAFDRRVGSGKSLLVDLEDQCLVSTRDFSVRTG